MPIPSPIPLKTFAQQRHTGGVPQDELDAIVGEKQWRRVHSVTLTAALAADEAHQINYHPFSGDAQIRIRIIQSDDTQLFEGEVNTILWYQTTIASDGDALVEGSAHTATGRAVAGVAGALLGRSSGNYLLLQYTSAIPNGATIEVWAEEWIGGAISERIDRIVSQPPKELRYIQRSSTEPSAPPATAEYDGAVLTGAGDWVADGAVLPGSDTEWLALCTATFNRLARRWILGPWTVISNSTGTHVQYSSDNTSWHNSRQSDDEYRRWRDGDGAWHYEDLVQHDESWQRIAAVTYAGSASSYDVQSRYIAGTDLDEWKFLVLEWVYGSGLTSHIVIPSCAITVAAHDAAFGAGHTRVVRFRRSNNGASSDDPDWENTAGSANHTAVFRWQLRRLSGGASRFASEFRFDPATTSLAGTIRLYRGR